MLSLQEIFNNKIAEIFAQEDLPQSFAVAVSGGSDSLALTLLLKEFCDKNNIQLFAITVDHKMRQASSKEALNLNEILQKKHINHQISEIDLEKIPQKNIEANLREQRYEILYNFCKINKIKHLFLGHIESDIAENFLIRLFRGSGLDGLSAISENSQYKKINLIRPLLQFNKETLQSFLCDKKLKWFEDESNKDEKFLRNKIRNFFNSFEEEDIIQKRIKIASEEISKMRDFFDSIMLEKAKNIIKFKENLFLINHKELQKLEEKFALKIISLSAMEVSGKKYKPRLKELKLFYRYLIENNKIKPRSFYGCIIENYDDTYLILKPQKPKEDFNLRTVLKNLKNENS
ncbi:MAG: tRNA lysidine(34) synthetase TilS [Pelagibacterales bacterium]|nr:tRNA lysidine(34) synthetase TilS [Pelagibacterales bacterium]